MKLSIVTINYNNADGLRKTMESVFAQTYRDFEYIVVDGASTDGSVDIIKEYAQKLENGDWKLENFQWISEPDTGIYNAMNKGLKMCHGEYVLMLNSGDFFVDEHVIERILPELHTEDIIQGNTIEEFPDRTVRSRGYGRSDISFIDAVDGGFPHQAMFIKLSTMTQYGYYDDAYTKGADSYFFITAIGFGKATYRYVNIDIANFDVNGISSMQDPKWVRIDKEEDERWYAEHMPPRVYALYETAKQTNKLYTSLHKHKWIWKITMLLVRISERISPTPPNIKFDLVK